MKFIYSIYKFDINGLNYIGSSWDCDIRFDSHKRGFYKHHHSQPVYKYAQVNNIDWRQINIEIIYSSPELNTKDNLLRRQTEQIYIEKYDSINTGLNERNAYITPVEFKKKLARNQKKYNIKNKDKIQAYQKQYKLKIKLKKDIKDIFKIWANYHDIIKN